MNRVASIDLGSHKLSAVVAAVKEGARLEVLTHNSVPSRGIKNAMISHMDLAMGSLLRVLEKIRKEETIRSVAVGVCMEQMVFSYTTDKILIDGRYIGAEDMRLMRSRQADKLTNHVLLGTDVLHYKVDGVAVDNPLNMEGHHLEGAFYSVGVPEMPLRNIDRCLKRCHVSPKRYGFSAKAAGLGCLTPQERHLGSLVLDMGQASTRGAIFHNGVMVHGFVLPVGGSHLTQSLAYQYRISLEDAEKLKKQSVDLSSSSVSSSLISLSSGDVPMRQVSVFEVSKPVKAGVDILCQGIRPHLVKTERFPPPSVVVITGGTSQLKGLAHYMGKRLSITVREPLVRPYHPQYGVAMGLLYMMAQRPSLSKASSFGFLSNVSFLKRFFRFMGGDA